MNLSLVGINARYTHSNLALRYLRQQIDHDLHRCFLQEFTIHDRNDCILNEIWKNNPDVVTISVYIWNSLIVGLLLKDIKKIMPKTKIILGGPEVSYNPDEWLYRFPAVDHIVCGAGEYGFTKVVEAVYNNENLGQIIQYPVTDLNAITFPYKDEDFPEMKQRYVYYESSRGCLFRCSFCISSRNDIPIQYRNLDIVFSELDYLISKKVNIIKFVDRTFNADKHRARTIWKYLIKKNPKTRFHFELHPALMEDKDFQILADAPAGLFQFEIGIQSVNPLTLESINRPLKWGQISAKLARLTRMSHIHHHLDIIVGLPFDDLDSIRQAFNRVYSLHADHFQMGFLKVLPGTMMAAQSREYNLTSSDTPPYEILGNRWLSYAEIRYLHKIEFWLNILYNSHQFNRFLENIVQYYSTPYDFFTELADFAQQYPTYKDWKKNVGILLDFCVTSNDSEFLRDCLRWDWCQQYGSHYYPPRLQNKTCNLAKKLGYPKLKDIFADNRDTSHKRAIFFMPSSAKFAEKYELKNRIVAFVRDHRPIRIDL
jgi:hypothetical protein